MKKIIWSLFFLLSTTGYTKLVAQDTKPHRLSISVSGGLSLPVGSYAKNDAAEAVIYDPDFPDSSPRKAFN